MKKAHAEASTRCRKRSNEGQCLVPKNASHFSRKQIFFSAWRRWLWKRRWGCFAVALKQERENVERERKESKNRWTGCACYANCIKCVFRSAPKLLRLGDSSIPCARWVSDHRVKLLTTPVWSCRQTLLSLELKQKTCRMVCHWFSFGERSWCEQSWTLCVWSEQLRSQKLFRQSKRCVSAWNERGEFA